MASGRQGLADSIEAALVEGEDEPLLLEGGAADATLVSAADGQARRERRCQGCGCARRPVEEARHPERPSAMKPPASCRPELLELLVILFILAVLTIVAGIAWTDTWWVLAPVIAALLGLRVATTRASGRFAWSIASVIWWASSLRPRPCS